MKSITILSVLVLLASVCFSQNAVRKQDPPGFKPRPELQMYEVQLTGPELNELFDVIVQSDALTGAELKKLLQFLKSRAHPVKIVPANPASGMVDSVRKSIVPNRKDSTNVNK